MSESLSLFGTRTYGGRASFETVSEGSILAGVVDMRMKGSVGDQAEVVSLSQVGLDLGLNRNQFRVSFRIGVRCWLW